MRLSLEWLDDFVELPTSSAEVAAILAQAGIEVEATEDPAAHVQGVVVGRLEALEAHPQASRLQVCTVFDGQTTHRVVCGAPNVRQGMYVALARLGARLPQGSQGFHTITRRTLRGVVSEGMLCSQAELGVTVSAAPEGIWELPSNWPLGSAVLQAAQITAVLSLALTPNRPDLFSHLGISREFAAFSGKRSKPLKTRTAEKGPDVNSLARVVVDDATACRRYVARVVRGLRVGPSPAWLVRRLQSIGQRSINNLVDATHYVMHELGHPLHAFDLTTLSVEAGLPTLHVRRAVAGESCTTLDGVKRQLHDDDVVLADASGPLALAGVLGGSSTQVSSSTVSVLLESAYFEPGRVRHMAQRHQLRTEAALRFGRGADPTILSKAVDRCAQLLTEIANGEVAKGCLEFAQKPEASREIALRLQQVRRLLGISLPAETVVQLLEPLEIRCVARTEGALIFAAPGFRPDLLGEVDLLEELARRFGYDRLPARLPNTAQDHPPPQRTPRPRQLLRDALLQAGLNETVTAGFSSPALVELLTPNVPPVQLLNPLGAEFSCMRTSLLPGILQTLQRNQSRGVQHVRLFEQGTLFAAQAANPTAADVRSRLLPSETQAVALLLYGGRHHGRWFEKQQQVDFSDLRGAIEQLAEAFHLAVPVLWLPGTCTHLDASCRSDLQLGDMAWGWAGQLSAALCRTFQLQGPVLVAELAVAPLCKAPPYHAVYRPLPKYPGTRRDVALLAPRGLAVETLRQYILQHAGGALGPNVVERVSLFDVYEGAPLSQDEISLAFAIEYRLPQRTLTDVEVGSAFAQLLTLLPQNFAVRVRC